MYTSDMAAMIRAVTAEIVQQKAPRPWQGIVVPGSWDPKNGTVSVTIGTTLALDQPLVIGPIPLMTHGVGHQAGPLGNERCIVFDTEGGYAAFVHHGEDDTPAAPAGEVWIQPNLVMKQIKPSAIKTYLRMQNDNALRLGGQLKIVEIAPLIELGAENNSQIAGNAVVRLSDLRAALTDLQSKTQAAINALAGIVQGGQGVASPTIASPVSDGSHITFSS